MLEIISIECCGFQFYYLKRKLLILMVTETYPKNAGSVNVVVFREPAVVPCKIIFSLLAPSIALLCPLHCSSPKCI